MANVEQLLHEAQFAFQSISFGESRENKRNASRAKSLCKKIIRKYPATMEAGEAHAILRRLGEEAYTSRIQEQHQHQTQRMHHRKPEQTTPQRAGQDLYIPPANNLNQETLNWSGLIALILSMPKILLLALIFLGIILFGLFGPLLVIPLVGLVLFTGPFRHVLKPEQRVQMSAFIARANEHIEKQRQR